MAFKKLQDSFTAPIFRSPESSEDDRPSLSEVEELDSSDSDFTSASGECLNGRMPGEDDTDGVSSTSEMGTATSGLTSELTCSSIPGDSDSDWNRISETILASTPQKNDLVEEEAKLYPTDSKSTSGSLSSVSSCTEPNIETGSDSRFTGNLRRSGTFTKEKPSLPIRRTRPLSTGSDSSGRTSGSLADGTSGSEEDMPIEKRRDSSDGSHSPMKLRRSGTFTKEKPSPHVQRTRSLSTGSDSSDRTSSSLADGASESEEDMPIEKRRDSSDGSHSPVTLRRSGTFTKEKPAALPSQSSLGEEENLDDTLKASDFV